MYLSQTGLAVLSQARDLSVKQIYYVADHIVGSHFHLADHHDRFGRRTQSHAAVITWRDGRLGSTDNWNYNGTTKQALIMQLTQFYFLKYVKVVFNFRHTQNSSTQLAEEHRPMCRGDTKRRNDDASKTTHLWLLSKKKSPGEQRPATFD